MPETVHACPPEGYGLTPCCNRGPGELSIHDRMTNDPALVTCNTVDEALVERLAEAAGRTLSWLSASERWYVARAVLPIIADLTRERDALRALFVDGALFEHVDGHLFYKIRKDAVPTARDAGEERSDG